MRLSFAICAFGLAAASASASFVVNAVQQGSNVVFKGSGSMDLSALAYGGGTSSYSGVFPAVGAFAIGSGGGVPVDIYFPVSGPSAFGNSGFQFAATGAGEQVGVEGDVLLAPYGYISGAAITDSMTFDNATFASLGITPGTYTWTWGSGANSDSLTLNIGVASTPEPASIALLLSFAGMIGFQFKRRRG